MAATPGTLGWWHHDGGGLNGVTAVNDGEWHHLGVIRREGPYTSDPPLFRVQARPRVRLAYVLRTENGPVVSFSAPAVNAGSQKTPAGPAPGTPAPPGDLTEALLSALGAFRRPLENAACTSYPFSAIHDHRNPPPSLPSSFLKPRMARIRRIMATLEAPGMPVGRRCILSTGTRSSRPRAAA